MMRGKGSPVIKCNQFLNEARAYGGNLLGSFIRPSSLGKILWDFDPCSLIDLW